ncbi:MAG: MarR family winged helix-turn-helix transcriptional regulator [Acidimicrobiales bacterium]
MPTRRRPERAPDEGFAYLLVRLGFHAAARFAEALRPLGLEPRHYGMLTRVAAHEGRSQQALGELLGLNPTRMVFLVDDLEARGLVERRRNPADRRSNAIHLTPDGRELLATANAARAGHEAALGAALSAAERAQLTALLRRVLTDQGIDEHSLPGPPPA